MLALLARHGANLLPLLLQLDETVSGGLPVRAVLEGFGLLDDGHLLLQVGIHGILELRKGGTLALEEFVAGGTETVIYFLVLLAGGKADGTPPGLDFLYLLGKGVPFGGGANFLPGNGFHLFTEGFLGLQVLGLLLLEPFEMGLVLLVDYGGGGAETLPDLFTEFLGHGAQVLPLLVEFLEFLEGIHHIVVLRQSLGRLAEGRLGLQVLLEIQIPEFAVNVHQVVELGHIQLVGVVHVAEALLGDGTHFPPAVLDVPELGEGVLHVSGLLHQGLELLDDGLLFGQILFPLGVQFLIIFGTLLLIGHVQ